MKTITLEEHFVTEDFLKATGALGTGPLAQMQPKLMDLGAGRIAAMDEGGVDLQVLSLASMGLDALDAATATPLLHDVNDELAAAVKANPTRLAGFAALALKDPASAAKELERCVTQLGFKGALIDGTTDGKFYDQPEFLPVFEAAVALNVPIYLHPAPPPKVVKDVYFSGLPGNTGQLLSIAGWGWHAETGLHILRLIVSGLFDRLPDLRLIVGHLGEFVPFALARSTEVFSSRGSHPLSRPVSETFRQQIHLTSSGYFTRPPFDCARAVVGMEKLMYSVDYPFSPNTKGQEFLSTIEETMSPEEFENFTHGNATRLLNLSI